MSDIRDCIQGFPMVPTCHRGQLFRSLRLVSQLYPRFDHNFEQLFVLSPTMTRSCLKIYHTQLVGHALRPTKDPYGLLEGVIEHIDECLRRIPVEEEGQKETAGGAEQDLDMMV